MARDDVLDDRHAEPCRPIRGAAGRVDAIESLGHPAQMVARNARTVVSHRQPDRAVIASADTRITIRHARSRSGWHCSRLSSICISAHGAHDGRQFLFDVEPDTACWRREREAFSAALATISPTAPGRGGDEAPASIRDRLMILDDPQHSLGLSAMVEPNWSAARRPARPLPRAFRNSLGWSPAACATRGWHWPESTRIRSAAMVAERSTTGQQHSAVDLADRQVPRRPISPIPVMSTSPDLPAEYSRALAVADCKRMSRRSRRHQQVRAAALATAPSRPGDQCRPSSASRKERRSADATDYLAHFP